MVNVLIYGAGAIGSLVGYLLSDAEHTEGKDKECEKIENVALLGRKSHIDKIRENGLRINFLQDLGSFRFENCFSSLDELKRSCFVPELVIVCVKTYSLPGVCGELKKSSLLNGTLKNASILLLMNGMGNREVFDSLGLSSGRVFEGITSLGVKFSEDGLIELKGKANTVFEKGISEGIREFLKERFEEKGFEIEFASDFKKHQWNKLFVNAVINPITALTGKTNEVVLSQPLRNTIESIIEECVSIAKKEGIKADKEKVLDLVYSVAAKTSVNTSSMLQDVSKGKRTEIDSINGYVIRLAGKHEIGVPLNETLYALVNSIEHRYREEPKSLKP